MSLSHLDSSGEIHMVDISDKKRSTRRAVAHSAVVFPENLLHTILEEGVPKGNMMTTARLAGIQAAKRTPELIPLAHPIQLSNVEVELVTEPELDRISITCVAKARDATGVEMEAMTGASVAALTLYDMCKSEHKGIKIGSTYLEEKTGGKSGDWKRNHDS